MFMNVCMHTFVLCSLYMFASCIMMYCRRFLMRGIFLFLQPIDPEQQAVVAIASSKDVVFQGGPQPWVLDSSKFFHSCKLFVLSRTILV